MVIFHTSDWHLGRMLYGRSLLEDQRFFLEEALLPAVERERPACLILAGDIYDRQVPPVEAIRLFDRALDRLSGLGCRVVAVSGNHDGPERVAIMKSALRRAGVYLSTELGEALDPVLIEKDGERAQIFPLPYFDPAQARDFFRDPELRGEAACMQRALEALTPLFLPGAAHILVSHCFAAGGAVSDSESIFVGGSGQVSPALFDAFDYTALGHLHGPQRVGEKARYSGSPLKYSVSEANQKKGFLRLTVAGGQVEAEPVEITPMRDVKRLSGSFQELLEAGQEKPCGDYVELSLTDPAPVLMAAERLRPYYPNLLSLVNAWSAGAAAGARAKKLKGLDDGEIFAAFMKDVCGQDAVDEDRALFREVWEEVGL